MRESIIESYLVEQVELHGGTCEKFSSPQRRFVPDRICTWHGPEVNGKRIGQADVDMVEVKATGVTPNAAQLRDHSRRRSMGQRVYVLDSKAIVDLYVQMAVRRMAGHDIEKRQTPL